MKWLPYGQSAKFATFHEEITNNKESTINEPLYLNFLHESLIKSKSRKSHQYTINDVLCLKLYSDTNSFQSALRRAFWTSSTLETRRSFYRWALQLYKTNLFHGRPLPRFKNTSKAPVRIYHGLNNKFVINQSFPMYHGPLSTSIQQTVAQSFSDENGLIWNIQGSYSNLLKLLIGIQLDWISQYKHEEEILLYNAYLPIKNTILFKRSTMDDVNLLIQTLQALNNKITDIDAFYYKIGLRFDNDWISIIKKHKALYHKMQVIDNNNNMETMTILQRLVCELEMKSLRYILKIYLSTFKLSSKQKLFGSCNGYLYGRFW